MTDTNPAVVVFAKLPGLRIAKSRIAETVGWEKADEIYREMLTATAGVAKGSTHFVAFTGADEPGELSAIFDGCNGMFVQRGMTLGTRLRNAALTVFAKGYTHACFVGCDCPGLTSTILKSCLTDAHLSDLIFGPATDGGYYLIQATSKSVDIFSVSSWSTPSLLSDSIALATLKGWSYRCLDRLYDVDTYSDYLYWKGIRL